MDDRCWSDGTHQSFFLTCENIYSLECWSPHARVWGIWLRNSSHRFVESSVFSPKVRVMDSEEMSEVSLLQCSESSVNFSTNSLRMLTFTFPFSEVWVSLVPLFCRKFEVFLWKLCCLQSLNLMLPCYSLSALLNKAKSFFLIYEPLHRSKQKDNTKKVKRWQKGKQLKEWNSLLLPPSPRRICVE